MKQSQPLYYSPLRGQGRNIDPIHGVQPRSNAEIPSHPPSHTDTSLESVPCIVPAAREHNWSSTANSTSFLFDQALKAKYLCTHTTVAGQSIPDTSFPTPFSPNSLQAAQDAGTELGSFTTEQIYDAKGEDLEGEDLSRPRW